MVLYLYWQGYTLKYWCSVRLWVKPPDQTGLHSYHEDTGRGSAMTFTSRRVTVFVYKAQIACRPRR